MLDGLHYVQDRTELEEGIDLTRIKSMTNLKRLDLDAWWCSIDGFERAMDLDFIHLVRIKRLKLEVRLIQILPPGFLQNSGLCVSPHRYKTIVY